MRVRELIISIFCSVILLVSLSGCGAKDEKYQVTFDSDGGTKVETIEVKKDEQISKPSDPSKEGYTFVEWTYESKAFDFNTKITKDITLKATWKESDSKNVIVTFKYGNGSKDKAVSVITGLSIEEPDQPTRAGYTFLGWYIGTTQFDFDKKITESLTISAKWSKNAGQTVSVTDVKLNKMALSLKVGEQTLVTATVNPSNATNKKVTWSTSNSSVVTVSNGTIKAVGEGKAIITATTANGKKATLSVTVSAAYRFEFIEQNPNDTINQTVLVKAYKNGTLLYGATLYYNDKVVGIDTNRSGYVVIDRSEGITKANVNNLIVK